MNPIKTTYKKTKFLIKSFFLTIVDALFSIVGVRTIRGKLSLAGAGEQSVKLITGFHPKSVWVRFGEPKSLSVCVAQRDAFDVRVVPDGVVVLYKINCVCRDIHYVIRG